MSPLRCHTSAGILLLVLVAATCLVVPAQSFSLDYLNVRIVFPYRGFNFNRLEAKVWQGLLNGTGVPQIVRSGTGWGPYVCSDTGQLFARVQLKANRQLLAMTYSGILGRRPTLLVNLSPQKGIYSNVTIDLATPTSGHVWNATITLA